MKHNTFIFILVCSVYIMPFCAHAAVLRMVPDIADVRVGDTFPIEVSLDTGIETINAIEGSIAVSSHLAVRDVRVPGSLVSLWVEPPAERVAGTITFAGIIPGGLQGVQAVFGARGNIVTLLVEARAPGTARLSFGSDTHIYRDDGAGTRASLTVEPLTVRIMAAEGVARTPDLPPDTTPPEPFTPAIVSGEPYGISGMVLVATVHDKDSGTARIELARARTGFAREERLVWETIDSPYTLLSRSLGEYLYVRATDRAGNTRVEVIGPYGPSVWQQGAFALLLIALIASVYMVDKRRRRRR